MLVNDQEMEPTDATYNFIDCLSVETNVSVQYPDGALWFVENKRWHKMNGA